MAGVKSRVRIKRVYDPTEAADGQRVLVDRLWPRGLRKEDAGLTLWLKDIAPSHELRAWFHHDRSRWEAFEQRYRLELAGNPEAVGRLRELIAKGPVTLLYAARELDRNHAHVLADYVSRPVRHRVT